MSNSTRVIELNKSCDNQVIELNKTGGLFNAN